MQVVTANRLSDGRVVYLDQNNLWQEKISQAQRTTKENGEVLLSNADGATVVDAYLIDLSDTESPEPSRYREQIRATGPSIDPGTWQEK